MRAKRGNLSVPYLPTLDKRDCFVPRDDKNSVKASFGGCERSADESCHCEQSADESCHCEQSADEPCHCEQSADEPCHCERSVAISHFSVYHRPQTRSLRSSRHPEGALTRCCEAWQSLFSLFAPARQARLLRRLAMTRCCEARQSLFSLLATAHKRDRFVPRDDQTLRSAAISHFSVYHRPQTRLLRASRHPEGALTRCCEAWQSLFFLFLIVKKARLLRKLAMTRCCEAWQSLFSLLAIPQKARSLRSSR